MAECVRHVYLPGKSIGCGKKAEFVLIVAEDEAPLCATHLIVEMRYMVKVWDGVLVVRAPDKRPMPPIEVPPT